MWGFWHHLCRGVGTGGAAAPQYYGHEMYYVGTVHCNFLVWYFMYVTSMVLYYGTPGICNTLLINLNVTIEEAKTTFH